LFTQVLNEDLTGELKIQMYGADMPCLLQSAKEFELSKYMHLPHVEDMSDFVQSPMPGTLISFSVKEGDRVLVGQELCIVEAMKMQNVVRSSRDGLITKLKVAQGASLKTDEVIMEFGEAVVEEAA
jgi:propionyl-CoA carboxylase alpha chain